ncbi:redoxin domain-containing protein [Streptomonospora wellingtoniae]|uniref:Redoxin domain-containing protein n=1 Tax=Streptomonospora wellingtoniae TaxID=3075544 RepID=A0ABU2KN04_9ACTN|nr:redoxin domain-containing protein [Streptomonospora sp. DSM 45055]MDT0300651.1 redoxin domain-containing protein [Streptomonospora sp. DSM 45055]
MQGALLRTLAAAAAAVLAAGCTATSEDGGGGPAGAPDSSSPGGETQQGEGGQGPPTALGFTAPTVGGGEIDGADLVGEPVVLWFWAPWCTVCRGEAPDVAETAERYKGDVEFIGVAGQGEPAAMADFVDSTGTGGMRHIIDGDGSIWSGFEVTTQPSFSFLRPSGTFLTYTGTMSEQEIDERVDSEVLA